MRALNESRLDLPSDDALDSGVIDTAKLTVLVLARPGDGLEGLERALSGLHLTSLIVKDANEAQLPRFFPPFAIVEAAIPGALDLIRKLAAPPREISVIALLAQDECETPAIEAGASATLRRPVDSVAASRYLELFQKHQALLAQSRELFERDAANALVSTTSRIAAAIAHEIRNPLAGARLTIDWLVKAPTSSQSERDEALRDIELALDRIDGTVSAIASLACGEAPLLEPLLLFEVAEEALRGVNNPRGTEILLRGDRQLQSLGARKLLTQAVVNLVHNAIEALKTIEHPRILLRVYGTGGEARISIRDNGQGVPPNLRDRIFEPFFSTKGKRGTGLGLAIARGAITSMGGALTLSTQGPGACFRIRLRRS